MPALGIQYAGEMLGIEYTLLNKIGFMLLEPKVQNFTEVMLEVHRRSDHTLSYKEAWSPSYRQKENDMMLWTECVVSSPHVIHMSKP